MSNSKLESGWDLAWPADLPAVKASWDDIDHLTCPGSSWTASPGPNENKPVACVTWYQAYAFCTWDRGFLPSYTERNYASSGGDEQRPWPWGSDPPDANHAQYCVQQFCLDPVPLLDVGSKSPLGDGRFGQADLGGNVWEWVLDSEVGMGTCKDCMYQDPSSQNRLDPGSGIDGHQDGLTNQPVATSSTFFDPVNSRQSSVGFRCARAP
jgi:formylglycine-generating enzyme required for sulfatase activity